jgi:hypothetical protein
MKPVSLAVSPGEDGDFLYALMDDGTMLRGWQVRNKEGLGWQWTWARIPVPTEVAGISQTSDMLAEIQKTSCMAHQPDTAHALLAEIVAMYGEAYPSSTIDRARRLLKDYGGQ